MYGGLGRSDGAKFPRAAGAPGKADDDQEALLGGVEALPACVAIFRNDGRATRRRVVLPCLVWHARASLSARVQELPCTWSVVVGRAGSPSGSHRGVCKCLGKYILPYLPASTPWIHGSDGGKKLRSTIEPMNLHPYLPTSLPT